ncbi:2Fe-2S iron-sulfur cluster-binding protein [Streptomyces sp. LP05-1]|uniref:2Fe-2S iron-sulfur cluster-binding protein n=1 Tax=Streptomyces pyxinae TaxID=2970734 RepID=A0ABT2CCV6_9ACTN|nr:2Fe-2S iron-sulfur cluster-binding protein [Streptomyces sp. LP05-1]MCS0635245.1 2Fe-2S iron-sulfur cluster-binding protein [Streptomyces sp. LP05-1]
MFHPLRVSEVERLTDDSVAVTFAVPPELRDAFRHVPGQHLTLRRSAPATGGGEGTATDPDGPDGPSGEEIRRTYSICSPAAGPGEDPVLRVGIRLVEGGVFSTYALKELLAGDTVDVMEPMGRFLLAPRPGRFAAVVGGSGITPVLSMATTLLEREPGARFCLIRSDRSAASTMFLEEVADLKDRYPDRFQLVTVLSREEQQAGLPSGRLDRPRLTELLPALLPVGEVDGWFLCGPLGLVLGADRALRDLGVDRGRIHQEIFHVDDGRTTGGDDRPAAAPVAARARLTATLDGRSGNWPVQPGESLLDTVLRARSDAPYACKGGVCGTCRAFLAGGEVRMDRNYALEPEETDAGYVLACQSHPVSPEVELDFDR